MKKHYTGEIYGKNMWPAARSYTTRKYKYFMDKVLAASPDVEKWLKAHYSFKWSRCQFSEEIEVDYINNNLAKCSNSWIKELKDLPVHYLVDAIREKCVVLFEKRRRILMALNGNTLPAVVHQLNAASHGLGHLKVTKGHPDQSEVTEVYKDEEMRRHVVYVLEHQCTCREWQVTGKPCPHALAVITSTRSHDMESYIDKAYSVEKFKAAYVGVIPNITDRHQWPVVEKGFKLLPPSGKKRGVGRQRKNRIPGFLERSGKPTKQVKCKGCGEKRTKKNKAKPGRKKSKGEPSQPQPQPQPPVYGTPRTRAAAAREAAAAAATEKEVLEAAALAEKQSQAKRLAMS
ncbi:uncharacterized protein LOC120645642 [Panicum virgatum]|uniref:uncharacterized protein LOC120645642 n=1 Tax=Panicum virgatum TaxID=38727 RepID=UPI0019D5600E|nr:uncharacterized protein LOC120645642 [Panicum virgatum]